MKVLVLYEKFYPKHYYHKLNPFKYSNKNKQSNTTKSKPEDYAKKIKSGKKAEFKYNNKLFFNDMKSMIYKKIKSIGGINSRNTTIYHKKKLKSSDSKVNGVYVIFRSDSNTKLNKKTFSYYIYPKLIDNEVKFIIEWHNGKTKSEFKIYNTWTLNSLEGTAITLVKILKSKK